MKGFTPWSLALRGLVTWRSAHAAVAAGVAVATAVLVGALVVGDSVRESLRDLTLERLGAIDHVVAPGRSFRSALADEIAAQNPGSRTAPLVLATASLTLRGADGSRHASGISLVGCDDRFGALAGSEPFPAPRDGAILTTAVAQELGAAVGDSVLVRTQRASVLPADSALGEKEDVVASLRVKVERIVEPRGLARFGLAPTQGEPRTVFLPLALAQKLMDIGDEATAIAIDSDERAPAVSPELADRGLSLDEARPGVWQLESRELVLPHLVVEAARKAWKDEPVQSATTYLANTLRHGDRTIPYSTVTGVEASEGFDSLAPSDDDSIVLSRWAADDLGAKVGDDVTLTFYEPESTHGVLREAAPVRLRVERIAELTGSGDRRWTPRLEGVTDAESIDNWDLPFELVETIRDEDERYWDDFGTTPKAFVTQHLAERLWGSRWGATSLLRIAAPSDRGDELATALRQTLDPAQLGFAPRPLREEGLAASRGSTPFDVLFLMFSLFLIGAALLLIGLLVALAIDARRREAGLLGALGFDRQRLRRGWLRELAPVAALGAVIGAVVGVAYAAGLLQLLRTVWIDAIGAPFVRLHVGPWNVTLGTLAAWGVSLLAIAATVRRTTKTPPRELLAGRQAGADATRTTPRYATGVALGAAALAGVAVMLGGKQTGEAAAGAFFGAGALTLLALLASLRRMAFAPAASTRAGLSLGGLALSNVMRRRGRSLLVVGLTAAACFLVLATSAFRLPPTAEGTGGFALVGQSDLPLLHDPQTPAGRAALGVPLRDEPLLKDATFYGFRVQPGEDASCGNLYQATQPRVLGAPASFLSAATSRPTPFTWAASANPEAPWQALAPESSDDAPTPVVLDFNTAVYSLKLYGGVGSRLVFRNGLGQPREAVVVGLLKNSVLQGDLVMSEANFLRHFPAAAGCRFFLIDAPDKGAVAARIEDGLRDYGFDATDAAQRLAGFLAVQNTYLATFQALGALGLVFGAVGLAVAQLRNLLERRGELALLRAGGFSAGRLRRLVSLENLLLLGAGLGAGAIAALVALLPLAASSDARPPWGAGLLLIAMTAAVGSGAAWLATRRQLARPLTEALRGD